MDRVSRTNSHYITSQATLQQIQNSKLEESPNQNSHRTLKNNSKNISNSPIRPPRIEKSLFHQQDSIQTLSLTPQRERPNRDLQSNIQTSASYTILGKPAKYLLSKNSLHRLQMDQDQATIKKKNTRSKTEFTI